jgi:hypothetical protein
MVLSVDCGNVDPSFGHELKLTIVHQALSTLRAQPGVFEDVSILGELSNPRISGV